MGFDTVINAAGTRAVRRVAERLDETGIPYAVIGDSIRPARMLEAIHEGFLAVQNITERFNRF